MYVKHWSWGTLILYFVIGLFTVYSVSRVKRLENKNGKAQRLLNRNYVTLFLFFVGLAVFRWIGEGIGGSDAPNYVDYFEKCLIPNNDSFYASRNVEILFRVINKVIRTFTANYHVFFAVVYSVIAFAFIYFVNELAFLEINYWPLMMTGFLFLSSFNTLRTSLSTAFLLLEIIFLYHDKKIRAVFFAVLSVLIQYGTIFHAAFFAFYFLFNHRANITKRKCLLFAIGGAICGKICQYLIIMDTTGTLSKGSFGSYARVSLTGGIQYYIDFSKLCLTQIGLFILFFVFRKSLTFDYVNSDGIENKRKHMIQLLCLYDILLLPLCYILDIWRTGEFFLLGRAIMWGYIFKKIEMSVTVSSRKAVKLLLALLTMCWFFVKIYTSWDKSDLMPYIFAPFAEFLS